MQRNQPRLRARTRGCFMFVPTAPLLGILAGIAVPAYQDYTIRAQTTEGLNLAAMAKAAVAESYAVNGKWPADLAAAGMTEPGRGKYVDEVTVDHGTVVITYGGKANAMIAGGKLTLRPTVNDQGDVMWSCGYGADRGADPRTGAAAPHATTVRMKYLPSMCRTR